MQTLVVGLGNPILTDDGVGILVARAVGEALSDDPDIDVIEMSIGGLRLMEAMVGYNRVILVDALFADKEETGCVCVFNVGEFATTLNTASTHDADLPTALQLGRSLGALLPANEHIQIVGITAHDILTFGETPTSPVITAVPQAVGAVLDLLGYSQRKTLSGPSTRSC